MTDPASLPGHRPDPSDLEVAATDEGDEDLDDTIVAPWWQRPANIVIVIVAVALIAGLVGWLVAAAETLVAPWWLRGGDSSRAVVVYILWALINSMFFLLGRLDNSPLKSALEYTFLT